jgi:dimethylargininase
VVYVGLGGRTDVAGIDQLAAVVEPKGWRVVTVPVTKVLHLKSAITALPDGTIVGWPETVDDASIFDRFLPTPQNRVHTSSSSTRHVC